MLEGTFHDRGDSYILPAGEVPPKLWTKAVLKKKHAILLPPESFGAVWAQRPSAFWCGICKKMLVELIKKSNDTKAVCFLYEIAKRILG